MGTSSFVKGIFFAAAAYLIWGILPLYWRLLAAIDPLRILSFRILFSLILAGFFLCIKKKTAWIGLFMDKKQGILLVLSALVLTTNWGIYIWAVNTGHALETSLGYYINPLISIVMGLCFFREKLRPLQWLAFGCAVTGVLIRTILSGVFPWIPLALAVSFGCYGLLKKKIRLEALEALGAETLVVSPIGLLLLLFRFGPTGETSFAAWQGLAGLGGLPLVTWILLSLCGAATSLPLYCFARGVQQLPLSAIGFTQFITPTIIFFLGIFVFGEPFPLYDLAAFGFIWIAVILYILSMKLAPKQEKNV